MGNIRGCETSKCDLLKRPHPGQSNTKTGHQVIPGIHQQLPAFPVALKHMFNSVFAMGIQQFAV